MAKYPGSRKFRLFVVGSPENQVFRQLASSGIAGSILYLVR